MQDNINILNELEEAGVATLLNLRENIYAVPDGYFNNLSSNISAQIFINSIPAVNYFNNLAENILNKVKIFAGSDVQHELATISPLLASVSKINVYSLPENYFGALNPATVINEAIKPQAKVISLGGKIRKQINYAVAACIAALVFGGGYLFLSSSNQNIERNAISAPLAKIDVQKEMADLSDEEITNYLKDDVNMAVYTDGENEDQQQNFDLQNLLNNISDQEIQQYLKSEADESVKAGGI